MDCDDVGRWAEWAQSLGLPTLLILAAMLRGRDWLEGLAAIIAAFRKGERP